MHASAAAPPQWGRALASSLTAAGFAALAAALTLDVVVLMGVSGLLLVASVLVRRPTFQWSHALVALLLVILFIPIRRYRIPGDLPFQLEPYRLLVLLIAVGWIASLLVDRRVRLRSSGVEAPVALVLAATVASVLANPVRLAAVQSTALKSLTFLLSFFVLFYVIVSVVRTRVVVDTLLRTMVVGGAVVGILAIIESRTGFNPFTRLGFVPFLVAEHVDTEVQRGSTLRAFGPAEHPIALSAALVCLVPIAAYLARFAGKKWLFAVAAVMIGVLATISRTGIVMLLVAGLVLLAVKPRDVRRFWPFGIPVLVLTHFLAPGTLGSLKYAFFPEGGLVSEQSRGDLSCDSAGRISDIGPTLAEVANKPFFGHGYGTRVVIGPEQNACILDNQWLGTVFDVGLLGFVAWLWLFGALVVKFGREAKLDDSARGWLLAALAASVAAYAVGMLTFDAFGFAQVTFLLFILAALGAATMATPRAVAVRIPTDQRL